MQIQFLSSIRPMCAHPHAELRWVSRLHEYCSRSCEFAHQTFAATYARDDTTARYALHYILAVPSHEVTIVNYVFLALNQLDSLSVSYSLGIKRVECLHPFSR